LKVEATVPSTWLLLDSGRGPSAVNMAWDEALLAEAPRLGRPVLRFYGWLEPAATFGYFQKIADLERMTALRPLIRRPTGGGLVEHDADWTYSLVFPPGHAWYALKAVESYRRVHEWIQTAFARCRIRTELSPGAVREAPGQCFIGAEQFDVLWQGRKLAGAAQRRTRDGLLIQGSIQPPPPRVARGDFEAAFRESARDQWGVDWKLLVVDDLLAKRSTELIHQKYARASYHERR